MNEKLLPLAMRAGLAGKAGRAESEHIDSAGLGETLIYPYGEKLAPCPACRGYNLERQWCQQCNQSGFVWHDPSQGEPVSDLNIYLPPMENCHVDNKN